MSTGKPFTIELKKAHTKDRSVHGKRYGTGDSAIIFSNMDTNDQKEWNPIIRATIGGRYMGVTYDYPEHMDEQSGILEEVVSFAQGLGVKKIVLIGASRGGVASLKVAARHANNDRIAGVVAISAPIEYEGTVFYSDDELRAIKVPKLLINSENDGGFGDNKKMMDIFSEPKELLVYSGDAHGTEIFAQQTDSVATKISVFCEHL